MNSKILFSALTLGALLIGCGSAGPEPSGKSMEGVTCSTKDDCGIGYECEPEHGAKVCKSSASGAGGSGGDDSTGGAGG
ncbi:MAG: hypothetical protein KC776_41155, partial [Myxococcales bacterium]|nr:hypothetical protein [Myxococcales bacterium]